MSNCTNCGKPLIIKEGKCIYCNTPVQGGNYGSSPETSPSTPWYKKIGFPKKETDKPWKVNLLRKSFISTIIALILAVIVLIIKPWPGCLISIAMLLFAIITGAYGIIVQSIEMEITRSKYEYGEEQFESMLNHILNLILLWGYFFFIVGVVCLFVTWWAVLIAETIGFIGMLTTLVLGLEGLDIII